MSTRAEGITRNLASNPLATGMLAVMKHEGKTDGMGYKVSHVQPGAGFSAVEYSSKKMENGRHVACRTHYPGPYDGLAGLPDEIVATYSVWVGWEEEASEAEQSLLEAPPGMDELPQGSIRWGSAAFDGPCNWYAEFDDAELAEAFAMTLPPLAGGEVVAPLCRDQYFPALA